MRIHRSFGALQPWRAVNAFRTLAVPEHLTTMRIEPILRAREPAAIIDLHFDDGGQRAALPLILVDVAMLQVREADPLVFPEAMAPHLEDAAAAALIAQVLPELEWRALRGGVWREGVVRYRSDPAFDEARERGWFSAAPLARSLPRIAAALYARRFAERCDVLCYGPRSVELHAFVRDVATRAACAQGDPAAAVWFGDGAAPLGGTFDVAIGEGEPPLGTPTLVRTDPAAGHRLTVVAPLPTDLLVSCDPDDGPASTVATLVRAPEPPRREVGPFVGAPPLGGSAGRIAVVVRADAERLPDADVDEALLLAHALAAEGFECRVVATPDELAAFQPDLLHLMGALGPTAAAAASWARERRIPYALHAYYEDPAADGYWGAVVTRHCFAYSADERSVATYLDLLRRRSVEAGTAKAGTRFAPPEAGLAAAEQVVRDAALVFVNSEREAEVARRLGAGGVRTVAPLLGTFAPAEPIGTSTGPDPFVLVHAPIGPAANQLVVVRAVRTLDVPLVLAGAVEDAAYAELVREFGGGGLRLLTEPSPSMRSALYAAAAVVVDASWYGRGHARIAAAAQAGAAVAVSQHRWPTLAVPERCRFDPADVESMTHGIGEAWDTAFRREADLNVLAAAASTAAVPTVRAIVAGYAKLS